MIILLIALTISALLICLADRLRGQFTSGFEPLPNCLLTRHPIVFITGHRSLFYFRNYWNQVPRYLYEHGYDVTVWELPWRSTEARQQAVRARLSTTPVHIIGDSSSYQLLDWLASGNRSGIASVTLVCGKKLAKPLPQGVEVFTTTPATLSWPIYLQRLSLLLHNLFIAPRSGVHHQEVGSANLKQFLNLCISLAENDARCSH